MDFIVTYSLFQALKHNGSLYAHVFFAHSGYSPDPSDPEYQPQAAFGRTHRMIFFCLINTSATFLCEFKKLVYKVSLFFLASAVVTYLPKTKADKKKSLLGNSPDSSEGQVTSKVCSLLIF